MKKHTYYIIIVAMLLLIAFSIMLIIFLHNADEIYEGNIRVRENDVTETTIPVRDLVMNPGVEKEYHVDLICDATGSYFIHIDFEEKKDGGMKDFVEVTILSNDKRVYQGPLTALLDDKLIFEFIGELDESEPHVLTFKYMMPLETGNEAQGTSSNFDIHIVIKKA